MLALMIFQASVVSIAQCPAFTRVRCGILALGYAESNMPRVGVEPTRGVTSRDFESRASASSATSAYIRGFERSSEPTSAVCPSGVAAS